MNKAHGLWLTDEVLEIPSETITAYDLLARCGIDAEKPVKFKSTETNKSIPIYGFC